MMKFNNKLTPLLITGAATAALAVLQPKITFAEDGGSPAAAPSTQPAVVAVPQRSIEEILPEFRTVRGEVNKLLTDAVLTDPQKRTDAAAKGIELLNKQDKLLAELDGTKKIPAIQIAQLQQGTRAELYLLKDPTTTAQIDALVTDSNTDHQADGKSIQLLAQWLAAGDNRPVTDKIVAEVESLDHAHPANSQLTLLTLNLSQYSNVDEVSSKLDSLVADVKTDSYAQKAKAQILAERKSLEKQLSFKDKPLVIAAKTVDGKDFTTADWKGKVVLVDYWATWCGPCRAGLPHVKEIYNQYHDKGLEIVGVSNDYAAKDLQDFTPANNMPWPQLLDTDAAAKHSWNPLTLDHGIRGIPTMWLIDKKGVLRSITARQDMDKLIPKLLAE